MSRTPELSAQLLARVAAAANGLRDGQLHWFVVPLAPPHMGVVPCDTLEQAETTCSARGQQSHIVLGPFRTSDELTDIMEETRRVVAIKVYFEGSDEPLELDATQLDALFLNLSALDKFCYPYYSALYGPATAAAMREAYIANARARVHNNSSREAGQILAGHFPWTEYQDDLNPDTRIAVITAREIGKHA